jgi:uncharacterized NAD(P)/FAD-binding protein YdhS
MKQVKTHESQLPSIAIIGMGFAGTWLEIYLLDAATSDMTIYEIESHEKRKGGGIAYAECDDMHQVNLAPERMDGYHDHQHDYLNWLNSADRNKWPENFRNQVGKKEFKAGSGTFPRSLYKNYCLDRLEQAKQRAKDRGLHIHYVPIMAEAVAIREGKKRVVIHLSAMRNSCGKELHVMNLDNGEDHKIITDIWVAATGHGPAILPSFMKNMTKSDRVTLDPWCPETAKRMTERDQNESILYIGTGMTTYDLIMLDQKRGHKGSKTMISRHGDMHFVYEKGQVFNPEQPAIPEAFDKATNKEELLHGKEGEYTGAIELFQNLTAPVEQGGKGMKAEDVLLIWQKSIPKILKKLPLTDVISLFRHKTIINTRCIGIAPEVGIAMEKAIQEGLELWKGDTFDMEEREDGIYVDINRSDLGHEKRELLRFDRVYSGLGMGNDFNVIKNEVALWYDIIENNCFTQPHRFGGVVSEEGGKLPGARAGYVIGMPSSGMRIESGHMPTVSGSVITIRSDFESVSQRIRKQLLEMHAS